MHTSLRIQKKYMDLIRLGEKRVEYRKNSKFYQRMFSKPLREITLHYQRAERLTFQVRSIRLIDRPARFEGDSMLPTKQVFAISIGRIYQWTKG